jgi:hypothetical protein
MDFEPEELTSFSIAHRKTIFFDERSAHFLSKMLHLVCPEIWNSDNPRGRPHLGQELFSQARQVLFLRMVFWMTAVICFPDMPEGLKQLSYKVRSIRHPSQSLIQRMEHMSL